MQRALTTELLDLAGPSYAEVVDDLLQIRRINRYFGGRRLLRIQLKRLLREDGPASPLRILDVATGSADLPLSVLEHSRKWNVQVEITALERNPLVLRFARSQTQCLPQLNLIRGDALALPLRRSSVHYALCSLFLHQLSEGTGVDLLKRLLELATRAVVINDLRRHRLHYAGAWITARAMTRNPITRNDAPASVRNAYTSRELLDLAKRAGASRVRLFRHWPFRICLILRP